MQSYAVVKYIVAMTLFASVIVVQSAAMAADVTVGENEGSVTISVSFPFGDFCELEDGCSIDIAAQDGTAISGRDYAFSPITLRWNRGDTFPFNSAEVSIIDNVISDGNLLFTMVTSNAVGITPTLAVIEVVIIDDEAPDVPQPQQSVRTVIDDVCPTLSDTASEQERLLKRDCEAVINAFGQGDVNANSAIQSITPDQGHAPVSVSTDGSNVQLANIGSRLTSVRNNSSSVFRGLSLSLDGTVIPVSAVTNGIALGQGGSAGEEQERSDGTGVFISGEIRIGERDDTDNEDGFELASNGLTVGMDMRLSANWVGGIALGYSRSTAEFLKDAGQLDTTGLSGTAFLSHYADNGLYVDAGVLFGNNSFEQSRRIHYSLNDGTEVCQYAMSEFESSQLSVFLGIGGNRNRGSVTLTPSLRFEYQTTTIDAYNESSVTNPGESGEGWRVHLESQEIATVKAAAGLRVSNAISKGWGIWTPYLAGEYVYQSGDSNNPVEGYFIGDPDQRRFSLNTDEPETGFLNLNLGSTFTLQNGKSAFIDLASVMGMENQSYYGLNAGYRWNF